MTASRIPFATLVSQLTDPDRDVRRKAIARIMRRRFEREQALSALVELSRDPDYQVFKAAIKAIVIINHTRVSSHILQLLMIATGSHPSVHRRVFMLKALAQVDYTQAIPYWLDALGDRSSLMRKAATTALKDARAFDPLVSLLCDPDPNLRLNAISGLRILC
ncbi:MAG TPA: HEAT repeat domain-containing protein [Ktedonobacteraceae bacterium]|nr:HEAT repeat domain-containing protein [Ktedonobacteraceae bacterium]